MFDVEAGNRMPFAQTNGFRFIEAADGRSRVELLVTARHQNMNDHAHGGVMPMLVDAGCTSSVASLADKRVVTASLHVEYLLPVRAGDRLTVASEVIQFGKRRVHAASSVTNGDGQVVALGRVVCALRTVDDAGEPSDATDTASGATDTVGDPYQRRLVDERNS